MCSAQHSIDPLIIIMASDPDGLCIEVLPPSHRIYFFARRALALGWLFGAAGFAGFGAFPALSLSLRV